MTLQISPEEMERYKRTARARWQAERARREARRERAWALARRAAALLKEQFGVERVVVFGSLTRSDSFSLWSDVDLAVWGLTDKNWLKAFGAAYRLGEAAGIEMDMVDAGDCSPRMLGAIYQEGTEL